MKIYTNYAFNSLFKKSSKDLWAYNLPKEIVSIINSPFKKEEWSISYWHIKLYSHIGDNLSVTEDEANSFHVDWYADNRPEIAFIFWIETLFFYLKN